MALRHLHFVLFFWAFVPSAAGGAVVLDDVPVRVYEATDLAGAARQTALDTARVTLAQAGVTLAWIACSGRESAVCGRARPPGELVLRIVRAGGPKGVPSAAAVRAHASLLPLGDAFVDLGTQSGVLATVYLDRVSALAEAARVSLGRLLGYAIAHELGHLLIGTNAHGSHGLMRPIWSRDEIRRGRASDWLFTDGEKKAMRAGLAARRAPICCLAQQPPRRGRR